MEIKRYKDTPYLVREDGEVFSERSKKWLVASITRQGYKRLHPHINGKHVNLFVNRMVAEVFIDNTENKPFVLHNDNNPLNNHVSNLRWGTQSENITQAYRDGRISAKGQHNGQAKLTNTDVSIIREARARGFKLKDIAGYYSMSPGWIGQICGMKRWQHL